MSENGMLRCYGPRCEVPGEIEAVVLLPEEIEVIRLIDLEGMEQEGQLRFLACLEGLSGKTFMMPDGRLLMLLFMAR